MLRAVHLEPNPFDIERELVTPTFKLKRPQLLHYYKVYNFVCLKLSMTITTRFVSSHLIVFYVNVCRILSINYTKKQRLKLHRSHRN